MERFSAGVGDVVERDLDGRAVDLNYLALHCCEAGADEMGQKRGCEQVADPVTPPGWLTSSSSGRRACGLRTRFRGGVAIP